jgi:uncharacterized membrane protein YphA (DoxX/SURF4 family)
MFEETNGLAGSWLEGVTNKLLDWKIAQASQIRWMASGASGTQTGIGADGSVYQRGQPAPAVSASSLAALTTLLPLLLVVGVVLLVVRALK